MFNEEITKRRLDILVTGINDGCVRLSKIGAYPDEILIALLRVSQVIGGSCPKEHQDKIIKMFKAATEGLIFIFNEQTVKEMNNKKES